jgi:hypothetical protein
MNRQDAKTAKEEPEEALDRLAYEVIGAAIEVHRHLWGRGFSKAPIRRRCKSSCAYGGFRLSLSIP